MLIFATFLIIFRKFCGFRLVIYNRSMFSTCMSSTSILSTCILSIYMLGTCMLSTRILSTCMLGDSRTILRHTHYIATSPRTHSNQYPNPNLKQYPKPCRIPNTIAYAAIKCCHNIVLSQYSVVTI